MKLAVVGEITARSAAAFVAAVEGYKGETIEVLVDSRGGNAHGAMLMGEALRRFKGDSKAIVLRAHSAALIAAIGASRVIAAKDASGLVHAVMFGMPKSVDFPSSALRAVANGMERLETEAYRLLASKAGPRELIIFSSTELAEHAERDRNTLRWAEAAHARLRHDSPRQHDAESSEREPCCEAGYMEAVARYQVVSAVASLRRAEETDGYWRRLAGKNEALTPERMLQEGLVDAISPASQSSLRAQHFDWVQALAAVVEEALFAEETA